MALNAQTRRLPLPPRARLLQERIGDKAKPADPARLYRMAPFFLKPRARLVEATPSFEELDPRTVYVLHSADRIFVWVGGRAHNAYLAGAHKWVALLQRFEKAPQDVSEEHMGVESSAFWSALGGKGDVAPKLAKYDSDYGVGKTPLLQPPRIELPHNLRSSGDRRDVPLRQPSGAGFSWSGSPRGSFGSNSPRSSLGPSGTPSPSSSRSSCSAAEPSPGSKLGHMAPKEPMPTHRGAAPSMSRFPLATEAPPQTPRGGRTEPPPVTSRLAFGGKAVAREAEGVNSPSKKPRDAPCAELYLGPDWEQLSMYDSDDLDDQAVFIFLTAEVIYVWVGADAEVDEQAARKLVTDFVSKRAASARVQLAMPAASLPVKVVKQGEEGDEFWVKEHWPNG